MEIIIDSINNIIKMLFPSDMITFWTAFGSIVGACVLGFSVYQLRVQNKRQNELDEHQKKIEDKIEKRENYQIELNIKQSLFERRISSWNILSALLSSIEEMNNISREFSISPLLMYFDLTNNFYLESIQGALGGLDVDDREWRTDSKVQNMFLRKLSEMDNISKEITLLFSGNEIEELKKFVIMYHKLLKKLRTDQILVGSVRQDSIKYGQNFDDLSDELKEQAKNQ